MSDTQGLLTYVERLRDNPDYQALVSELEREAAQKIDALVNRPPGTPADVIELARGEIRGLLVLLNRPSVYQQALSRRREQAQNG